MEEGVFHKPNLAKLLAAKVIEARLHTDIAGPHKERVIALQKHFSGNVGLPVYVLVDPANPDVALEVRRGLQDEAGFTQMIEAALAHRAR